MVLFTSRVKIGVEGCEKRFFETAFGVRSVPVLRETLPVYEPCSKRERNLGPARES